MTHDTEAIRAANPIKTIVEQAIDLQRAGKEWKACCPFHSEKTPSFYVIPDKDIAHCFGCDWSGDVIKFVMDYKSVSFLDALSMLGGEEHAIVDQSPESKAERERQARERDERERAERQAATEKAIHRWEQAEPADPHHPYLTRKGVEPHTIRQTSAGDLILPVYGPDGEIQSVQTITDRGDKRFQFQAPISGGRMMIGINMGRAILCEGFATGASIYEAIPDQVVVAYNCGNMEKLAREYAEEGRAFILAADNNEQAATKMVKLGADLGVPVVIPPEVDMGEGEVGSDFNDMAQVLGIDAVARLFRDTLKAYSEERAIREKPITEDAGPVDLWAQPLAPELPRGLLPSLIERFAFASAEQIGADPAGLAMSALAGCASVISDRIKLKPKRNEQWTESARIWVMLIGPPSARKTPAMSRATSRIKKLDTEMLAEGNRKLSDWQEMGGSKSEHPKPPQPRLRIGDSTTESAQEVCKESPNGVLLLQDELSGLFGRIDKYGGKGGSADRSFWLEAYGGGQYAVNRIGRGAFIIDNLSISILGGIQPEKIKSVINGADDDGMIQRFIPVVLRPAERDRDVEAPAVANEFGDLLERLHGMVPPSNFFGDKPLVFSEEAMAIREELADEHFDFVRIMEGVNTKFSAHVGKYDGLFPRLCVIWHCVENSGSGDLPDEISGNTARRVATFLREFVMQHAHVFYGSMGNVDDHDEVVKVVGGWILSHSVERFTVRDLTRNVRAFKNADDHTQERAVHILESFGWAEPDPKKQVHKAWEVPAEVHQKYIEKAASERQRRAEVRMLIQERAAEGERN